MIRNLFVVALILAGVFACKQANKEELQQLKDEETFDETSAALQERFGGLYEMLPISEMGSYLESINAEYNGEFANDPAKAAEYRSTPEEAAVNLGIYYMDLHYVAAYQKTDLVAAYYNAMQSLAEEIGIGRALNQVILEDFQENLLDNPEAKKIVENALVEASKNLNTDNRPRISTLVMAGLMIERLHLMASIILQSQENEDLAPEEINLMITPLMKGLFQQKDNIDKMAEAINLVRTADDSAEAFPLIYELQGEYNKLAGMKDEIDLTEVVDPALLGTLIDIIEDIRELAVQPGVQERN